jgi:predicted outer membrane repeat protein
LTLTDSLVTGNSAAATSAGGGLITAQSAVAQIAGTTFSGNTAGFGGGIAVGNATTATIVNSTFSGNTASGGLGGGAILANGVSLTLNNVTITNNSATSAGGLSVAGAVTFANTIIAGNSALHRPGLRDCCAPYLDGVQLGRNNTACNFTPVTGDQVGTSNSPIDPLLSAWPTAAEPNAGATATAIPTTSRSPAALPRRREQRERHRRRLPRLPRRRELTSPARSAPLRHRAIGSTAVADLAVPN